jgi:antirestriction protein ArdC
MLHAAAHFTSREENIPMATVYDLITERIIVKLQQGTIPQRFPVEGKSPSNGGGRAGVFALC